MIFACISQHVTDYPNTERGILNEKSINDFNGYRFSGCV